ncbi:MAG TPA: hypothetical protein VIL64_03655 [Solirubrobacteraceae bacterium]
MTADTRDQEQRLTETTDEAERDADRLEDRLGELDEHVKETRKGWEAKKQAAKGPTAAGDAEDADDAAGGEDASGFDDPEADEEEDSEEDAKSSED